MKKMVSVYNDQDLLAVYKQKKKLVDFLYRYGGVFGVLRRMACVPYLFAV